jgi:hypothetical protein
MNYVDKALAPQKEIEPGANGRQTGYCQTGAAPAPSCAKV